VCSSSTPRSATNQIADLGRTIGSLKLELGEKTAALQTVQAELAAKAGALEEAERALASRPAARHPLSH